MYTGFNYLLMRISHYLMDIGIPQELNKNILEIGGGTNPHFQWNKKFRFKSYIISDTENHVKEFPDNIKFILSSNFESKLYEKRFSRIIASHVLEHLSDPEVNLLSWTEMLSDDGVLSIALPCDPGLFWHLCRQISSRKAQKVYQITKQERNLIMAREHINSIYNLLYIIDYYFITKKIIWFPAALPFNNINLLCIITLYKKDFKNLS